MGFFLDLTFAFVYIHDMTRSLFTNFALVVSLGVNILWSNVTVEYGVQGLMTSLNTSRHLGSIQIDSIAFESFVRVRQCLCKLTKFIYASHS